MGQPEPRAEGGKDDFHPSQLFANPDRGNGRLKLQLGSMSTNRVAIGARVQVVVTDETRVNRAIHRTVGSGVGEPEIKRIQSPAHDSGERTPSSLIWSDSGGDQIGR